MPPLFPLAVNGVVPEKFDAVKLSHMVDAEYGNQGVDFKFVAREGFGWTKSVPSLPPSRQSSSCAPRR